MAQHKHNYEEDFLGEERTCGCGARQRLIETPAGSETRRWCNVERKPEPGPTFAEALKMAEQLE